MSYVFKTLIWEEDYRLCQTFKGDYGQERSRAPNLKAILSFQRTEHTEQKL